MISFLFLFPTWLLIFYLFSKTHHGVELARFPLEMENAWNTPEPQYQITQKVISLFCHFYIYTFLKEIEATFYEELQKLNPAAVKFGHKMTSFTVPQESHEPISVHYTDNHGAAHTIHTQYLVGCDGPHSATRKALGLSYFFSPYIHLCELFHCVFYFAVKFFSSLPHFLIYFLF
jgi:2-polyprenyl-6-methoxyphenol hydroxylase-like FAD-dependent oxidoreductase